MRSLALANQKGGTGKTTVTVGLGAAAALAGYRVLILDLDPQGHATVALGRGEDYNADRPNLATVLTGDGPPAGLADLVILDVWAPPVPDLDDPTHRPVGRLDLIPSSPAMFFAEADLYRARGRELRLARLLTALAEEDAHDLCLIDCPPSLGVLTDNALAAAREVLVVAGAEPSSAHGLDLLLGQVRSLRDHLDLEVTVAGVVANRVENTLVARDTIAGLNAGPLTLLGTIPKRTRLQEAWAAGVPVQALDPRGDVADALALLRVNLGLTMADAGERAGR